MADSIELRNIRAWGKHGCCPGEQDSEQPFDINLMLEVDSSAAVKSDDLADAVDYALIYRNVVKIVSTKSFKLMERLADEILRSAFADKRVLSAQVSLAKPGLLDGATAIVTIERVNQA